MHRHGLEIRCTGARAQPAALRHIKYFTILCLVTSALAKGLWHVKLAPVGPCDAVFSGAFFLLSCSEGDVCISIGSIQKIDIELHLCCSSTAI